MVDSLTDPKELRKAILRELRSELLASGNATKVELSRKTGISFPTVSKFLAQMETEGEITSAGLDESSGGRRAKRYAYNPEYRLGLALFLEKTETHYSIFNSLGEVKEQGKTSSVLTDGVQSLTKQIGEMIAKYPKIRSIAIGVPGAVNNGRIIYIPGYDSFQQLDLKEAFEERFSLPVVIENDMNAAVLGYHSRRPGKGNTSLVYLYFGQNGPGAGILINGNVVRGSTYFSGEVSFVPQYDDRNFLQALNGDKAPETPHLHDGQIDAVGRLVVTFAAILNPHAVIFCNDEVNEQMLNRIAAKSAEYIPEAHLPELILSDWKQDYLAGLQALGLGLMVSVTSS